MRHHFTADAICVCVAIIGAVLAAGCGTRSVAEANSAPPVSPPVTAGQRQIRATGLVQAVRASTIQVPQILGQNNRITLVKLVPNGTRVKKDDVLAEFDRNQQIEAARDANAKAEDLAFQVKQKEAQNKSDAEKRTADIKQAEADLAKAEIQLKKGPVLSDIDRMKNEAKAESARACVASLQRSHQLRLQAEAAALKVLELQMQRQKVALDRAQTNSEKMVLKAPIDGMVALENLWRNGSMGHAQEGDQLWTGQALLKIFDPREMEVRTFVGEPDGAVLRQGTIAKVYLDAYPDAVFRATFHAASPVATTAIGSPIKNFTAWFRMDAEDARLLPDLSAAVVVEVPEVKP